MNGMKKIGRQISIRMGIVLSFFLSLVGNLASGHFALPGWLISFVISTMVSLIIGFLVPMKNVTEGASRKLGLQPGRIGTRCVESLVSDLIYTPIITLLMVAFAYFMAVRQGARLHFLPMFLSSLGLCMIVGFVLIFLLQPIIMRRVFRSNGITRE